MEMNDPRIGLDFGDYKIVRKLAQGGMGAVYLAEHEGMHKIVKFILGEGMQHPAIRERFKAECKAVKRFRGPKYPGIVDIDSFGERNGELYLVMEYIDGVTLEDHLRNNLRLTEHHTFHIMLLCLRALSDVHAEGIVHRDLKPSNVFLRQTADRVWDPTIIDFGIVHDDKVALPGAFKTVAGQTIGTPGYMSTEQYGAAHKVTPATDIFACAVMMWEMLTGQLPWGVAPDAFEQHNRQLHQRPIWPTQVPLPYAAGWKQVLEEALSPDPMRRPQSAQLFALLLAQRLAPIPPYVPDGLGMISKLATRFLQDVPPELETVRQSDGRIDVAAFWTPHAAGSTPARMTPSEINLDAIRVSAAMPAQPAPSAATVNARPQAAAASPALSASAVPSAPAAPVPMLSTLSAANGSLTTAPSRTRLAALGLGAAVAIGGIIFGATRLGSRSAEPTAVEPANAQNRSSAVTTSVTPAPTASVTAAPVGSAAVTEPPSAAPSPATTAPAPTAPSPVVSEQPHTMEPSNATPPPDTARTIKHAPKPAVPAKPRATEAKPTVARPSTGTARAPATAKPQTATTPAPHAGSDTFDPDAIKE